MCNIFDQDTERLAKFAAVNGFSGIDWSIDPSLPEREFLSLMKSLSGFQVATTAVSRRTWPIPTKGDDPGASAAHCDQVSCAGGRHDGAYRSAIRPVTVLTLRAIDNLSVLVAHGRQMVSPWH
jgi:hypothetical protein